MKLITGNVLGRRLMLVALEKKERREEDVRRTHYRGVVVQGCGLCMSIAGTV